MLPKKSIEQGREREETADHFFCSLSFILDETLKREREREDGNMHTKKKLTMMGRKSTPFSYSTLPFFLRASFFHK